MPALQFPPYALLLLISAVITIGLGIYGLTKAKNKVSLYFGLAFFTAGFWPLMYGIELMIADTDIIRVITTYKVIPIQFFPPFIVAMLYHLLKHKAPPRWMTISLYSFLVIQVTVMLTNNHFFPIWESAEIITTEEGFNLSILVPGIWLKFTTSFYHNAFYIFLSVLTAKAIITHKQPYKNQFVIILTTLIIGSALSTLYTFRIVSFGDYNPIPGTLSIISSLYAYAIFRYNLMDIIPYARESVFDLIDSAVLIVDEQYRLIDFNPSARTLLRFRTDMIGKDILETFKTLNLDWKKLADDDTVTIETRWGTGINHKFSVLKQSIQKDSLRGYIIIFNDITTQVDAIQTTHEREIVTYKENILGDMHDGIGGVVAAAALLAASALEEDDPEQKNIKIKHIAMLLENGSFELRSMLNILDKDNIDWKSLVSDMRNYSTTVLESKSINRKFTVNGLPYRHPIDFNIYLSIFRLFKEIIANIIKHSHAKNVDIELYFNEAEIQIQLKDDGIGIEEKRNAGFGLKNMHKRVESLKGKLEITSQNGTTVNIYIPVHDYYTEEGLTR
ncbi:integral membrane sensor signal transduction histidine kinase [Denitrovibrio acetiphilus DSM 12809]|uniref:histidine kinase n=1 Tax=Denitrovibrio acetiphilus (strain DSM 12809 / NBRC 114555 / N2460) TaxID=522772 RepID=D4H598_DENA2|nr:histidine kinase N-terminal 7TM domain-containing protein [Denitrovibrio acetiphilus]ADD67518.1 integral membrane sensor signal transduction histidine kinase [Denitrovibrio acetiphilus DSM 12809]